MNVHVFLIQSLSNSSVVVKSSCAAVVVFYLIGLIPQAYDFLSISPSLLLPPNFQVWTLVTGLIVEESIINVIINVPVIILCGQHLEPLWGALELLKFIAISSVGTALMTSFVSLAAFAITNKYAFWAVRFSGMAGVVGGLTVAFKQLIPDQKLNIRWHEFRVHDCPMLAVLAFVFLSVIRVFSYTQPIMISCGVIVGWTYLRFYQPRGKGMRGDLSEGFAAATLLPKTLRPTASLFSEVIFRILVKAGVCKNPVRTYDVGGPSAITISLPGTDPADAERRRKKALRALNERLNQSKQTPSTDVADDAWPTLDDAKHDVNNEEENNKDLNIMNDGNVKIESLTETSTNNEAIPT